VEGHPRAEDKRREFERGKKKKWGKLREIAGNRTTVRGKGNRNALEWRRINKGTLWTGVQERRINSGVNRRSSQVKVVKRHGKEMGRILREVVISPWKRRPGRRGGEAKDQKEGRSDGVMAGRAAKKKSS